MPDRPIIFSAPMVRALLDGKKTQTRRLLNPQPALNEAGLWRYPPVNVTDGDPKKWVKRFGGFCQTDDEGLKSFLTPCGKRNFLPYAPVDRLYVREALARQETDQGVGYQTYAACGSTVQPLTQWYHQRQSIPSIHMPRWASRITLTVTAVRVQRLQEISEADAVAEGVERGDTSRGPMWKAYGEDPNCWVETARISYIHLWNSLHGPNAWDANPWVVAPSFTVRHGNIDQEPTQ